MAWYLGIDIGASSGRHILGWLENGKLRLEEIYRFENGMTERNGRKCWDSERLFREIVTGIRRCKELGKIPVSISIDTWGVDFALLDKDGNRLGDTVAYRDSRTEKMPEQLAKRSATESCMREPAFRSRFSTPFISCWRYGSRNRRFLQKPGVF